MNNSTITSPRNSSFFVILLAGLCLFFAACNGNSNGSGDDATNADSTEVAGMDGDMNGETASADSNSFEAQVAKGNIDTTIYKKIDPNEEEKKASKLPPCNDIQKAEIKDRREYIKSMKETLASLEDPESKAAYAENIKNFEKDLKDLIKAYKCEEL